MFNFNLLKSKTFWFTVAGAIVHVATSWNTPQRVEAIAEGISAVGAMGSLRSAVESNGPIGR